MKGKVPEYEKVVQELYRLVTIEPGSKGEWDKVRALFLKEAVVILRTGFNQKSIFDLEGFINDFTTFIENYKIVETGFTETIIRMNSTSFGEIAHVLVLYEAHIPGSQRPPSRGIDSIQLIKQGGTWKVASIVNEVVMPGSKLPEGLNDT
jgi:hypothetical protein